MAKLREKNLKESKGSGYQAIKLRPVLADVAEEAGVAVSTVSAIMRKQKNCFASKETRQRVLDVAKDLGYYLSPFSPSPRQEKTNLIALILPNLAAPHITMAKFATIEEMARDQGYRALIGTHQNKSGREENYIREFLQARADGFIIYPTGQELKSNEKSNSELIKEMVRQRMPLVLIESPFDFEAPNVSVDRELGCYLQVKHLVSDVGCKKLAFLCMETSKCIEGQKKLAGYKKALQEAGLRFEDQYFGEIEKLEQNWFEAGEILGRQLVESGVDFDGVVLASDNLAPGVIRQLNKAGKSIPQDVAVIGFDDEDFTPFLSVPLSTIHQPRDVGVWAFNLLLKQLKNNNNINLSELQVLLKPELVVRESTKSKGISNE